jgi:hypothetical protein
MPSNRRHADMLPAPMLRKTGLTVADYRYRVREINRQICEATNQAA